MTRADKRKYHYIYKITRLDESGKYYIGMHSTDNIDDEYFGSGSYLSKSIKKHGKDKHKKEILEFLPTREALKLREKEIVNEELLGDKMCMNLKLGGGGGFDHLNNGSEEHQHRRLKGTLNSNKSPNRDWGRQSAKMLATKLERGVLPFGGKTQITYGMLGKKHSAETRQRMSKTKSGSGNTQFGMRWVKNGVEVLRIPLDQVQDYISQGYVLGRKQEPKSKL